MARKSKSRVPLNNRNIVDLFDRIDDSVHDGFARALTKKRRKSSRRKAKTKPQT